MYRIAQKWSDSFHGGVRTCLATRGKTNLKLKKKKKSKQRYILEKIKVSTICLNIAYFYDIGALTNSSSSVTQISLIIHYSSHWELWTSLSHARNCCFPGSIPQPKNTMLVLNWEILLHCAHNWCSRWLV